MNILQDSIQISSRKYYMLAEEIRSIFNILGFTESNTHKLANYDEIISLCYKEL